MTKKWNLSPLQKQRLASASQQALSARQKLHLAQITGAPRDVLDDLKRQLRFHEGLFDHMLRCQGLRNGDLVCIAVDGPFKGVVGAVKTVEPDGRLKVEWEGDSCWPMPQDVVMVEPRGGS